MKIKIPKLVRKLSTKYISKMISEELGVTTNIENYEVILDTKGDDYRIYVEVSVAMDKKETRKFIKEAIKKAIKRESQ